MVTEFADLASHQRLRVFNVYLYVLDIPGNIVVVFLLKLSVCETHLILVTRKNALNVQAIHER